MLNKSLLSALMIVIMALALTGCTESQVSNKLAIDSWDLAVQTYTFRKFTLFESIEKAQECGIECIEAFPNQVISKDILDQEGKPLKLWYTLSDQVKDKIKAKLKKHNVRMTNFGVAGWVHLAYEDEEDIKVIFDFLKDMGVETFLIEPHKLEIVPVIDKYARKYKIKVGIHNHPSRSDKYKYRSADSVLKVIDGTSKYFGAAPDVGHWVRSGLDPVEELKKLDGRIVGMHLKDVKARPGKKHKRDVPFGTGLCKINEVLHELNRQGFTGVITIEYESNPDNPTPEVKQCVEYYNTVKAEIKTMALTKL